LFVVIMDHSYRQFEHTPLWHELNSAMAALEQNQDLQLTATREHVIGYLCQQICAKDLATRGAQTVTGRKLSPQELADGFLGTVAARRRYVTGKEPLGEYKTSKGMQSNGLDIWVNYLSPFTGYSKTEIYAAMREVLRREGEDNFIQSLAGVVLLNLVPDAYGQVDELIDIVAPVFDVSGAEIAAFLVEQVGLEVLLKKIEVRKAAASPDLVIRLEGIVYQARSYHGWKNR